MTIGVVSISGFNFRALIAYCRFADSAAFKIHLLAKDQSDPVFLTKYADWVDDTRSSDVLHIETLLTFINKVKQKFGYQQILILPISEYFNRLILTNRKILEDCNVIVPLVSQSLYTTISNKYSFGRMCESYQLLVPKEVTLREANIPFVAKPKSYNRLNREGAAKPYLVRSIDSLNKFKERENIEDFYFQEFISGESFYLLLFLSKEGSCYRLSQKNVIQQFNGRSIIAAQSAMLHREKICDDYVSMLKSVGFHGLVMIELKKIDGSFYMIEANPRIWGPSQLVLDSGGEIIREFFRENGVPVPLAGCDSSPIGGQYYYWSGGIIEDGLNQSSIYFHGDGYSIFHDNYQSFAESDVFLRADTIDLYIRQSRGTF